jgi:hypothetical protein
MKDGIRASDAWRVWWVTQAGPRHLAESVENQDHASGRRGREMLSLVVADGVGSCSQAREGARAAVSSVVSVGRAIRADGPSGREFATRLMEEWNRRIPAMTRHDHGTTALWCLLPARGLAQFGQIGDGVVAWGLRDGSVHALHWPADRDSFQNETRSISSAVCADDWYLATVDVSLIHWVLCATDGISDDIHPHAWAEFGGQLARLSERFSATTCARVARRMLIDWPRPCHTDDKSLAFALRTAS